MDKIQSRSMQRTGGVLLLAVVLLIGLLASEPLHAGGPAKGWDRYQAILWTFGDRKLDADFWAALKALHITGINREETAPAAAVGEAGLVHYVGHAVGKGILHLREKDFQPVWDRYWRDRDSRHLTRPHCLQDPEVIEQLMARLERTIQVQAPHGPLAYSLDDEISLTRRVTPIDFCFCPHCLGAFRTWLKTRYGTLDALNARWRMRYAAWEEVRPFTADAIKWRERRMPRPRWVLEPWSDHRAFMDQTLADTLTRLRERARERGVTVPVGFLGGQAPAPYGGYDWGRLLGAVDWVEAYDQGGAMELIRGLAPHVIRVRTYFRAGHGEGANRFRLWKYFAHGDRGAILWSDREVVDEGGRPTDYARGLTPVLAALTSPAAARILTCPVADDGIAVNHSPASTRVTWMEDSARDGRTWMKRFGSYEAKHATHYQRRRSWHRLLEDAGYQYRYVDARAVSAGQGLDGVRVVILPGVKVMSAAEIESVDAFLRRGGHVVADSPGQGLRDVLQHRRAFLMRNNVRRYAERPAGPAENQPVLDELRGHLKAAGLRPSCLATDREGRPGWFEVIRRPAADGCYYFVILNLRPEDESAWTAEAWQRSVPVRITFPGPTEARGVFAPGRWKGKVIEHEVTADRPWVFFVPR